MSNMSHKSRNTLFLLLFLVIVCAASWLILRITDGTEFHYLSCQISKLISIVVNVINE